MGSRQKSRATTTTSNSLTDSRIVAGDGAFVLGQDAQYSQWSDDDISVSDSRSYSDSRAWDNSIRVADSSTRYTDASDRSDNSQNFADLSDRSTRLQYSSDSRDYSDRSSNYADLSDRSDRSSAAYLFDSSNRSTTNITGIDPGAVRVAQFGAELVRDLNDRNTDAIRFITGFGADAFDTIGGAATDIYARSGANTAQSWKDTVGASERLFTDAATRAERLQADTLGMAGGLIGDILDRAGRTVDASGRLAEVAMLNAQPTEGKIADGAKWALIAAAGVAAVVFVPRLLK